MTSKKKRFELYETINKWLEYTTFCCHQKEAIRSLLQTLKQIEDPDSYNRFLEKMKRTIKNEK